jgi:hypothetical protein
MLFASAVAADENPKSDPNRRLEQVQRYVLTPSRPLTADEQAALTARGVRFEHALTGGRYLVRVAGDTAAIEADPTVATLAPYSAAQKVYRSAVGAAARNLGGNVRLTVRFHDDVSFDDAQSAVAAAAGEIENPFARSFNDPKMLVVWVPPSALTTLAEDPRVMLVGAAPRRKVADNAVAASLSKVTPLFSAPYNLTGNNIVMSIFELGAGSTRVQPDVTHPEFGGRLVSHYTTPGANTDSHGTHTSGTIIAAGNTAAAKGMAPNARLNAYDATDDNAVVFDEKLHDVPAAGSVSDNNSWGFCLGWQPAGSGCAGNRPTWDGCFECFGGYDGFFVAPYDKVARSAATLFVHSAGNDGFTGTPDLDLPVAPHLHVNPNTGSPINGEIFCYSQNGSGTDCPAAPTCTAGTSTLTGEPHCEITKHPTYGPFGTLGLSAGGKNVIAVGAVDQFGNIGTFSSRGPATDGRVKPDLVAKGVHQYSTQPNGIYSYKDGTSMAAPVVTGIAGLMVEQWRKTFNGASPTPQQLKTLLIAGADDLGNPGPDYTFGFGLADAKASADLIIADAAQGNRIRGGTLSAKQTLEFPVTVPSGQNSLRVVVGWSDPEVLGLGDNDLAGKTLVNDLDVKVIDPSSNTVLPWVLDKTKPDTNATRGVNSVDNTEEVEIANPVAGNYRVVVTANTIGDTQATTQNFVLIANALVGTAAAPCTDAYEPNDSAGAAYGDVPSGTTISAKVCSATDTDFFRLIRSGTGTLRVRVTATDTPLTVTEYDVTGATAVTSVNVAAGQTADLSISVSGQRREFISIKANGTVGTSGAYTALFTYPFTTPAKRRAAR